MPPDQTYPPAKARILVVDDDPEVLATVSAAIDYYGFVAKPLDSGQAALECIGTEAFDLIITDCRMTPVDGWEVLRHAKRNAPDTPVIMLTGFGELETAVVALRQSADDFLLKPVESKTLISRMQICLDRAAMQKRARLAESRLVITNRAIEALQVGLVICEARAPDYPVIFINHQFETLTGCAKEGALEQRIQTLEGSCAIPETIRTIRKAMRAGEFFSGEVLNFRGDGSPFWNHLTLSPVENGQGPAEHYVATIMDISARKLEEDRRRSSDARYRRLFENTNDAQVVYDAATGRIEDANPAALKLLGYRLSELTERTIDTLKAKTPAGQPDRRLVSKDLLDKPVQLFTKKDGTVFAGDVTSALFVAGGKEKKIQTIKDITPRLSIETRLKESENRFRQLSENIDEVFWLANHDLSETLYISPSYEQMWRRPCEEMYLEPESRLHSVHPDDRINMIYTLNVAPQQAYEMAYRLKFSDGSGKWVRERGFPIRDDEGQIYRFAVVFSDITEEKRLRDEMEGHLQRVVHTDRLAGIGEMVAGVAHEINNPNSFITYNVPLLDETWRAFAPIIADYAAQNPDATICNLSITELLQDMADIIDAIRTGSERINRIVKDLKDFARLDESASPQAVCLNSVLEKALSIVGAQLRRRSETIDLFTAADLPRVQGHPQKIEQVIVNLLVNAARALPRKKGGHIVVRTRALSHLQAVLLEVEDNGQGIAPEHIKHLFEPFFTTRRAEGGTGLGLSVSYGLVKEHRGRIGVLSRPGRGSCFKVFFPLDDRAEMELNPTILCVDDQPAVLKLIRSMLITTEDRFVQTVADAAEVIPYLEAHPEVDLVISDVMMPGMDGWQLLKLIRKQFPLTGVILFSGRSDLLDRDLQTGPRPDAIVAKPFERAELVRAIQSVGRMRL